MNGKFFLIESVPARVNVETGEQFFFQELLTVCNKFCGTSSNPLELLRSCV